MKTKNYYLLPCIERSIEINTMVSGICFPTGNVPLSWMDGQYGAIPVFTNKRIAKREARRLKIKAPIIVLQSATADDSGEGE